MLVLQAGFVLADKHTEKEKYSIVHFMILDELTTNDIMKTITTASRWQTVKQLLCFKLFNIKENKGFWLMKWY